MSEYQFIKMSVEDRTAILTIDHPPVNALNFQTVQELVAAFQEASDAGQVKVIIITGAGQAFGAGADINEIVALKDYDQAKEVVRQGQAAFSAIEHSRKPVIAAINGRYCLGGLNELAMACHIRLAEDSVQFGNPEINRGIMPGFGGTQRLPRLVGKGKALEMMLTAGSIKAQEAYRVGLVNKVVPVGTVVREAKRWAQLLSTRAGVAMGSIIQAVNEGLDMPLEDGLEHEADLFAQLTNTEDMYEGLSAFLQKRRPTFQDK
jgi:enoyl-CoA hydratase/carnithine racemase